MRDSASEAIVGIDLKGTIVSWSAGAEAIYGYEPEEAVGEPISLLAHEADSEPMRPAVAAQLGQRIDLPSTVHRHKDGGDLAVSLTVAPIPSETGAATGAVVITRDIGEPQRAEARQRESEAKYRALTEHLPTITYLHPLGERGTPLYVSPQVGAVLGYSADEWLAKPNLFFQLVHADDRERVSAEIAAAAAGARPLRCEYRMLSRDGRVVWVHDEAVTVRDDDGRPLYVQGYLLDVSERRHAGEERERLLAAERAAAAEALDRQRKLDILARAGEILGSTPELPGRASPGCRPGSARAGRLVRRRPAGRRRHGHPARRRARRTRAAPGPRAGPRRPSPRSSRWPRTAARSSQSRACASPCGPAAARSARSRSSRARPAGPTAPTTSPSPRISPAWPRLRSTTPA